MPKDNSRQTRTNIIMAVLGALFIIYLCALGAYVMAAGESDSMAQAIGIAISEGNILQMRFDGEFIKGCEVFLLLYAGALYVLYARRIMTRHYKDDEANGTAKWMNEKSIREFNKKFNAPFKKPYADGEENIIYSENCQVSMNTWKTGLNNNSIIVGGPGSGKSRNVVRPNLLQAHCSYVITDPSGELKDTTGSFFESKGYKIRVFNLVDMSSSNCYNPLHYIRSEEDVLTAISCFIQNTTDSSAKSGDPFWEKSETALLEAIIFYLLEKRSEKDRTFANVSAMVRYAKVEPGKTRTKLDVLFEALRVENPNSIAVKQYDIFKQAGDKTAQSILITTAVRLAPFNIPMVAALTSKDDIDLAHIGDEKTVTYIIVPQGNNPYGFLVNMLYSQMFDTLYYHASTECQGLRLKYDVQFILDEFANIGVIPAFLRKLTTMRKYGMACMIFIQAVGQIKTLYKDDWETIVGACDTMVYLGGNELSSMEDLSKKMGDQTIRVRDSGSTKGRGGGSDSKNYRHQKRALLSVDEIRRIDGKSAIVLIKGLQPFYDHKYDPGKHKNAKYLGNLNTGKNIYTFNKRNLVKPDMQQISQSIRMSKVMFAQQHKPGASRMPAVMVTTPLEYQETAEEKQAKQRLQEAFNQHMRENGEDPERLFDLNPEEYYQRQADYIRSQLTITPNTSQTTSKLASGANVQVGQSAPKVYDVENQDDAFNTL